MYPSRLLAFILIFACVLIWGGICCAKPMADFDINVDQIDFAVDNTQVDLGASGHNIYRFPIRRLPVSATVLSKPTGWRQKRLIKPSGLRLVFSTLRERGNPSMIGPGENLAGFNLSFNAEYPAFLAYVLVSWDISAREKIRTRGQLRMPLQGPQPPVPEPTSVFLVGSGLVIAGGFLRARRRKRDKTQLPS